MSRNLPALPAKAGLKPDQSGKPMPSGGRFRRWLGSPVADAAADVAPDLLRVIGRAIQSRPESSSPVQLPVNGASGLTVSEIEISISSPLVRRIVVRTTSAWSISPDLVKEDRRRKHRGRIGAGAMGIAGLALLGLAATRRSSLGLPGRPREE